MTAIDYARDDQGIVTLTMDMPGQAVNTMTQAFRDAYREAVERIEQEREKIIGVILTSNKPTFFAGGDLKGLLAANDAAALFARAEATKATMRRLEKLGKPVVAAINGAALGGGFELGLACHARFAINDGGLQLGLPETTLGLIPGAGGIVRLVCMLGLEAAMPLVLDGVVLGAERALELKLLNGLARDEDELLAEARSWILDNPDASQPWDRKGFRIPGSTPDAAAPLAWLRTAPTLLMKKHRLRYPALEAAMSAAVEGAAVDFDTASRIESRYLAKVAVGGVAKNMIRTLFFQMNEIKARKSRPEGIPDASFARIGVLGAGLMGRGIAQVAAQRGISVVLKDVSREQAEKAKSQIQSGLERQVEKGRLSADRISAALALIKPTGSPSDLAGSELIIEAVFEDRDLKRSVTQEAEPYLAHGGIFASNTSTLPITGLAQASASPANYVGLHFFSPVDRMPLVEIIKGATTSAETLARAYDFVRQINKTPIVVNDSRGFFTSRVFGTFTREAGAMLAEGVDPAAIENAAIWAGMPAGPLAVMDETSLALAWSVRLQTIADLQAAGKSAPAHPHWAVVDRMVNGLKRPGRAGGRGFYEYPAGGKKRIWPGLREHFPPSSAQIPLEELSDRFLFIQAIEAVRCLEEKIIESSRDANIGAVLGIGYPRWTGGPLQYIDMIGPKPFALRASELATKYGDRFHPPRMLVQMADGDGRFCA
ncbi:3-hydroxybutyryl-CoA epimerase [Bradyrhizobium oligotrophicum S58]|uniref:enoyl-CoA hydratase n=1 Tax=Bradyrhizobium oligotrophicum S58 TaxID=1245469 RepID=M4Z4P7_9BRAD|nr:3-hydroxyacyl-CoA dehydrogenase NAD-binding domain-containing protein [Bradyrhizobium oligotrophicum]BAM88134.1 3-hydroxybutyryl-CoA epimerase [Bradyrhizobium oligotrophicum S58]